MKRDINLLPNKKGDPRKTTSIIVIVMVAFLYILIFGLGILIPKSIRDTANALNNGLQNQINELQPQVDEYEELKAQLDVLRASMRTTGALNYSKYDAKDSLKIVQSTCPTGVMIKKITTNEVTMSLDCLANNNYLIAQFALELERSGHFEAVSISGSSPADNSVDENNPDDTSDAVQFSIYLVYDLSFPDDDATAEGDGE